MTIKKFIKIICAVLILFVARVSRGSDCQCGHCPIAVGVTVIFKDGHSIQAYVPWTGDNYCDLAGGGYSNLVPPPYQQVLMTQLAIPPFYDCTRKNYYPDLSSDWLALQNEALAHGYSGYPAKHKQAFDDGTATFTFYKSLVSLRNLHEPGVAIEEETQKIPQNLIRQLLENPRLPLRERVSGAFRVLPEAIVDDLKTSPKFRIGIFGNDGGGTYLIYGQVQDALDLVPQLINSYIDQTSILATLNGQNVVTADFLKLVGPEQKKEEDRLVSQFSSADEKTIASKLLFQAELTKGIIADTSRFDELNDKAKREKLSDTESIERNKLGSAIGIAERQLHARWEERWKESDYYKRGIVCDYSDEDD
jgi:hypothetical protein